MPSSIGARLRSARHQQWVGRAEELQLFRSAVEAGSLPFCLLAVYGPPGVGKTTLLNAFAQDCEERHLPYSWLEARHIEPAPEAFLAALRGALHIDDKADPNVFLHESASRHVLFLDTYEQIEGLDGWMRETFLPSLPENVLVVLSGRISPVAWRSEAGWQTMLRTIPLRNLSPDESAIYLTQRTIPAEQHAAILDFTHGYPLALSLVADVFAQRGPFHFDPDSAQDIVSALLERLLQKAPDAAHRAALETCALVHLTTETLLAELNPAANAPALFAWLRSLSFMEVGWRGLFPHDVAREALLADLRWRDPDRYADLHRRARAYYMARLQATQGQEQQRILMDYIFLHRDNAVVRSAFQWQESAAFADQARPEDTSFLLAMTERHEGPESARCLAFWLAHPAQQTLVFRETPPGRQVSEPLGFLTTIALDQVSAMERNADPAIDAACHVLERQAPLRPGETALHYRFWMARDTAQEVSPVQSLIIVNIVRKDVTTPGLAYTFFPCRDVAFWMPALSYAQKALLPEAGFVVGDQHYSVFGHDWRVLPPVLWLSVLAEQEIAGSEPTATRRMEPLLVLSEAEFSEAVRDALRFLQQPERLHKNPLLRSRLVVERSGAGAPLATKAAALCACLREAFEELQAAPRLSRAYRALQHTYFQPAPTQEQAAEILDLPFSTYRRHLTAGVTQIAERLWRGEIGKM